MNAHPAASNGPDRPASDDPELGESVPELGWPVGAVSERLGIAAPTLRSWDRRHGLGPSLRTSGNHRRYTELDIRRVRLMARLTAQGVPAQGAADSVLAMDAATIAERLGRDDDGVLGREDPANAIPGGTDGATASPGVEDTADLVEAIVGAARSLDARTMALLYRQVMRDRDVGRAWVEVFVPVLTHVGELWQEGRLGVQAEHLASELLQSELRAVVRANRLRVSGRPVLLASADDEQHHLPLLAIEAELSRLGVASLFLGPRVPAEALVAALRETRPPAVFLWASIRRPPGEPLWSGLREIDWPLEVVVGGPGWGDDVGLATGPTVSATGGTGGPVTVSRVAGLLDAVERLASAAAPRR